jgi:dienelactone hydrolase
MLTNKLLGDESDRRRDVPWLTEVQQPPRGGQAVDIGLRPLLVDDAGRPIDTLDAWRTPRERIRRWWLEFLGAYGLDRRDPPSLEVIDEDRVDGVTRQLVRYEVEPQWPVEAYLLKPSRIERPCPGAVVLHSTVRHTIRQPAGVEGRPEKAFGLKLARLGYVTLCPRCFLWSSDLSIPYLQHVERFHARHATSRGMAKMLYDAIVAVDILARLPEVDSQRLGAVGHSLGAKEVLYLAALDERIRVTVSSEGGVGTRFSNWDAPWYLGKDIRSDSFDHEHHELLALVAPRAFLLIGGDSADGARSWPFIEAAMGVYRLYGGAPRVGLFNHKQGHSVPPEAEQRIYEWLTTYG